MANVLSGNPVIVDTQGSTMLFSTRVKVAGVRWVSAGASAGHLAEIQDSNSNTIWKAAATGSNYTAADAIRTTWPNGFKVNDLDSGTLYIYLQEPTT